MTSFQALTTQFASSGSLTGGYDAVLALSEAQANAFLFHQYASSNPDSPNMTVSITANSATAGVVWALDGVLGPPLLSFGANNTATLQMEIVSGALLNVDLLNRTILSGVNLGGGASTITGTFEISAVKGAENQVGVVTLDFGTSTFWQAAIDGVSPTSTDGEAISNAVGAAMSSQSITYTLGTLATGATVTALTPTAFTLATPTPPTGVSPYLLVLITMSGGTPGNAEPTAYPIPDGATAALLISNETIFKTVLPTSLNTAFGGGSAFAGVAVNGVYSTVAGAGQPAISLPAKSAQQGIATVYTGSGSSPSNVDVPIAGMAFAPSLAGIAVSGNTNWTQSFNFTVGGSSFWTDADKALSVLSGPFSAMAALDWPQSQEMNLTVTGSLGVAVNAQTDTISFTGTPTASVSGVNPPSWFAQLAGALPLGSTFATPVSTSINAALGVMTPPPLDVFCTANLLFPQGAVVSLSEAAVPCDLYAAGTIQPVLQVGPQTVSLAPGQSQAFTATLNGQPVANVLWECAPATLASFSGNTLTVKSTALKPTTIVVTVIDEATAGYTGYAIVTVEVGATAAVSVSPAVALVPAGLQAGVAVTVTDTGGAVVTNPTVTASVGQITKPFGGVTYIPPKEVSAATPVTVTATDNNGNTVKTSWTVLPVTNNLALTPSATSVAPAGSITVTAASPSVTAPIWGVYSTAGVVGTVTASATNPMQATFTAAATAPSGATAVVFACGAESALAVQYTEITVS